MRAAPSPSTSSEDTDDEEESSSADEISPRSSPPPQPELPALSGSSVLPVERSGEVALADDRPGFGRGQRVMRTVMVVEFKVVEVTHISIRTQRPRSAGGQPQSSQDCTTDDESEALDEAEAIENKLNQAIHSLDSLNDQIVQFIFSPGSDQPLSIAPSDQPPQLLPQQQQQSEGQVQLPSSSSSSSGAISPRPPPSDLGEVGHQDATCSVAGKGSVGDERGPPSAGSRESLAASSTEDAVADAFVRKSLLPLQNSSAFLPQDQEEQRESLKSSMALMRRLLVDAQAKFRRMMEENKALASRIDGDIQTAHQEVSLLRAELADTNKRITQITNSVAVTDKSTSSPTSSKGSVTDPDDVRASNDKMKVLELMSGPSMAEQELNLNPPEGNAQNSTNGSFHDRTKNSSVVQPLTKKPPLKSAVVKQGLSGKRSSVASTKSGFVTVNSRLREETRTNAAAKSSCHQNGSNCSTEEQVAGSGAVNLLTSKSQDADDEGANADCEKCRTCFHKETGADGVPLEDKLNNLEEQNDQLNERIGTLQKELDGMQRIHNKVISETNGQDAYQIDKDIDAAGSSGQTSSVDLPTAVASSSSSSSVTLKNPEVERLETELKHAKEALAALKSDRKRLKAEKFDLLNQMKQLYGTLEDKEKELRDFIRNYEQRMRESDDNLKQLVREREDSEREKWNILKHARDEAERSVALCAQLGIKEAQVKQLQDELTIIREKLGYMSDMDIRSSSCRSNGYRSPSATSMHTHNGRESSNTPTPTLGGSDPTSSYDGTPTITVDRDSGCSPGHHSMHMQHRGSSKEMHRPSLTGLSRSAEEIYNSSGSSDTGISKKSSRRKSRESKSSDSRSGGGGTWGSISRVFSRSRHRKSLDPGFYEASGSDQQRSSWSPQSSLCASPLTEDSYTEKLKLLEEAQGQRMDRWKAGTVLAWLEITLGMPQYGAMCAENIKSGKILLELSDSELEAGLGIANAMHRRKLRLAIEEHRDPSGNPYPKISHLTHTWVIEEWLPSLGLLCYADNFTRQLVDGRVLETISKKDLEKSLGVSRKFHQVSFMHAIQLLRMVKFDKQLLQQRRSHSESMDVDPLVWTNQRFIKWAKSIDLVEYADNLRDSGVHGALVVLEASFQADTMATALGIPASKNIIRRHLTTELENLVQPARMSLEAEALVNSKRDKKSTSSLHSSSTGSLGRNFLRSSSKGTLDKSDNKRRSSMRGSLTRALGLKLEDELSDHSPQTQAYNTHRHNSTPELAKKSYTVEDISSGNSKSRPNFAQRRSLSASRVKLGAQVSNNATPTTGSYIETMTVTPV